MSDPNPQQDSREKPDSGAEVPVGLAVLKKAADKIPGVDRNLKYTEKLLQLQGGIEPMQQLEGISYLQEEVIKVIAKLKKKNPQMDIARMHPASLDTAVSISQLPLSLTERAAIDNLNRLLKERGATTDYILRSWSDVVGNAEMASKGWSGRLKESFQKDPIRTGALLVAGAAGIYIGYKILKGIFGWFKSDKKEKDDGKSAESGTEAKEGTSSWLKKLLAALGIMAAGSIIGKEQLKKILSLMKLDDLKEILEKGGAIPDWAKNKIAELEAKVKGLEGVKEKAGEAAEKAKGAVAGAAGAAADKARDVKDTIVTEDNKEELFFLGPSETLIQLYCFNAYKFNDKDLGDIRTVFQNLRNSQMSQILALWNKHKDKEKLGDRSEATITDFNGLPINKDIQPKNVYAAIKMIGVTFEYYKKHISSDTTSMTFETFLEHIAKDPAYKISAEIQGSLIEAIKSNDLSKIDLTKIDNVFDEKNQHLIESFSKHLGINIENLKPGEKGDFIKIVFRMFLSANLYLNENQALEGMENLEPKAVEAAKKFYSKVKTNTLNEILPGCITKFNIHKTNDPKNADVLKNALEEIIKSGGIRFKHAVQLNIVAKNIDLKNPQNAGSHIKEMALLYVLLNSIPPEAKDRYLSTLGYKFLTSPTTITLPSLLAIMPYINKLGSFTKEAIGDKLSWGNRIISEFVSDRSPEEQKAFIEKVKNADTLEFLWEFGIEGATGGLRIAKQGFFELLKTAWETGKVPIKEWKNVENAGDFISLIVSMGGVLFIGKDKEGRNIGVIKIFGNEFFFRPLGNVWDSIKAGAGSGPLAGLKVYAVGAAPYVAICIASGLAAKGSRLMGFATGFTRGLAAPLTIPAKGIEILFRAKSWGSDRALGVLNLAKALKYKAMPSQNIKMLLRDVRLAEYYYGLSKFERNWVDAFKEGVKHPIREGKRLFAPHYNHRMRIKYALRLVKRFNRFFKFDSADKGFLRLEKTNILSSLENITKRAGAVREFITKISNHPEFTSANAKRMEEIIEDVSKGYGLSDYDKEAMIKRLRSEKKLGVFKKMMNEAAGELGKSAKINPAIKEAAEVAEAAEAAPKAPISERLPLDKVDDVTKEVQKISSKLDDVQSEIKKLEQLRKSKKNLAALEALRTQESQLQKVKSALEDLGSEMKKAESTTNLPEHYRNTDVRPARKAVYKAYEELGEEIITKISAKEVGEMVKATEAEAAAVEKGIAEAASDLKAAKTEAGIAKAEGKLSKLKVAKSAVARLLAKLSEWSKASKAAGGEAGYIQLDLFDDVANVSKAVEAAGQASKLKSFVKWAGKWGGMAGAGAGAGLSLWQAGSRAYDAITTDVEGRSAVEASSAALWAANGAADTALFTSLIAQRAGLGIVARGAGHLAKHAVFKGAGKLAVPLIPLTYAGEKIYDTWKEETLTSVEWAQKQSYEKLIHEWFSTVKGVSLGDAWVTGFRTAGKEIKNSFKGGMTGRELDEKIDESIADKKKTLHKIYKVLVVAQDSPEFLRLVYNETASKEKDKKIGEMIEKSYTKYHEYYFQNESPAIIQSYGDAKEFIAKASIFNEIMQIREKAKANGETTFQVGPVNLLDSRYDFTGTVDSPKPNTFFLPSQIVEYYHGQMLADLKKMSPEAKDNMDKMETSYLLLLYSQGMGKLIEAKQDKLVIDDQTKMVLTKNLTNIRVYLRCAKGVNVTTASFESKTNMSLEEVMKHFNDLNLEGAPGYKQFEKQTYEAKPGVYAIYKLAQYFGYSGDQKEDSLKKFFDKSKASFQGVYWDGSNWRVQEEGWEIDETMGSALDYKTVEKMVNELYQFSDNILEHRQEALLDFGNNYDYSSQVKKMALILQSGYNEGVDKYEPKSPKLGHIAPAALEKKEVGKAENFKNEYETEVARIKGATGWSQMQCEVKDRETVELSRSDSSEKTTLKKSGEKWNVGDYAFDVTFTQAVAMGNMLNYTKKLVTQGNWKGGSSRPFEVDGNSIDFDKVATPFDTRVIDGDRQGNWLNFMNGIGVSKEMLIDILNNWYQKEHR